MLKAYKVSCRDEDHGAVVVFAERGKNVSRYCHSEFCDCEFIDRKVRRDPSFDKYAPGPVTIAQYISEGWYWGCSGWSCHEEMLTQEDNPIIVDDEHVFCSEACMRRVLAEYGPNPSGHHESIVRLFEAVKAHLAKTGT